MALALVWPLGPDPAALLTAVIVDLAIGDPEYRFHPVRLIGRSLTVIETALRRLGANGYGGGILLFLCLAACWLSATVIVLRGAMSLGWGAAWTAHVFLLYSLLALGDLLRHGREIERAVRSGSLERARRAVSRLVGRDSDRMDGAACRRAAVESLSENLADGFVSPVFFYALGGLPLMVLFKVVSTMDSMVGYKTDRYLRFGWCGARLDDVMNFLPARLTWLLVAAAGAVMPECSGRKALSIGYAQHALLPGPNAGWSEAAMAGAVERRLVGPIWLEGALVTDLWLGDPADPPLETARDYDRASALVVASGLGTAAVTLLTLMI